MTYLETTKDFYYYGQEEFYDDHKGHVMMKKMPLSVCDKTAAHLLILNRKDIFISKSTFFYDGGGCC